MSWVIVWEISALGALRRLRQIDPVGAKLLHEAVKALGVDPRPTDSAPLGGAGFWRMRAGDYRAIYHIDDAAVVVTVINVGRVAGGGHRRPTE